MSGAAGRTGVPEGSEVGGAPDGREVHAGSTDLVQSPPSAVAPEPGPPVVGEEREVEIDDVAFGGRGVARVAGKAVFVPYVIDGERVRARIVRDKKRLAEAELCEVLRPSPWRVAPPCPYFGRCGGCAYQHVDYPHQLAIKARQVAATLQRLGHLGDPPVVAPVASPAPYGYRNRIRVHAAGGVIGFYAADGRTLLDIERCALAAPEVNAALARLRASTRVRRGDYTLSAPGRPGFFEQTNDGAARQLLAAVATMLPERPDLLVDAYCGAGFFGRAFAGRAAAVVGIEANGQAVARARKLAGPGETYCVGEVGDLLGEVLGGGAAATTAVIVDPPAGGLAARVSDLLLGFGPATAVYVACDPGTLARDLARLAAGYEVAAVVPVDMFPQTAEIEVAVKLVHRRRHDGVVS